MKRFLTFSFLTFAVLVLLTNDAMAQTSTFVTNGPIAGFQFSGMPQGDLGFSYLISMTSVQTIVNEFDVPVPQADPSSYLLEAGSGQFTIWFRPPTSGTVTIDVNCFILGELKLVISDNHNFGIVTPPKTPSLITLTASPNPVQYGAQVTFIATVTGSGNTPSGTVTLKEGSTTIKSGDLTAGSATITHEQFSVATHSIMAEYSGDNNFDPSSSVATPLSVIPATLTVIGITADPKTYDGGISATLHTAGASLLGVIPGDAITPNFAATGTFADKNAANGKTVTVSGVTISGASIGNYSLVQPTTTANITLKELTVTGITAVDRPYDGTSTTAVTGTGSLVGKITGDNVSLSGSAVGSFDSKNWGSSKPVTINGLTLAGDDKNNYLLTQPSTSASIARATASVAPAVAGKIYGTSDPVLTGTLTGFVAGEVSVAYSRTPGETAAGVYTISATLSPASALDNYTIAYGTAAFTITKATASVTPNAATKVFGTSDPTLTGTLAGFVAADNVTAAYARTTGETVAASPYVISATLSPAAVLPNYEIAYKTADFTITKNISTTTLGTSSASSEYGTSVTFTATVTGAGTPSGTVTFKEGASVVGTGTLNGSGVAALSISTLKVAGSPHSITAVYGGDANFDGSTSNTIQQAVTVKPLTVAGITASDKFYDGSATAVLNTGSAALVGVVGSDVVTLNTGAAAGSFDSKNFGTNKHVTISGLSISGTDAGNYSLTQPSATAAISKKAASATPAAAGKIYGAPEPVLTGSLTGFVAGEVSATCSRVAGETVGGSPYTISAALSPAGALDNYDITYGTAAFTITKATASVTPNAATKVFGSSDPAFTGTLTGFVAADNVTAAYARTPGESVTASPYVISATLSPAAVLPNYNITYNTANFNITTNTTTIALGTSAATIEYGQSVTFTATVAPANAPTGTVTFNDGASVLGTGTLNGSGVATLSTSSLQVAGSSHSITAVYGGDGNFAGSTSGAVQQTITAKALTVTGITASNRVYDGSTVAVINLAGAASSGAVSGDVVSLNTANAVGKFNDKNVGVNKPVAVTGILLSGAAAGNYSLTQPATTASITAKGLTVTGISANDKVYDGTTNATLNTSGGALVTVISPDVVTLNKSTAVGTFSDKEVGTNKTVTISGLTISGTDAGNYLLTQPTTTASITAAPANTGCIAGAGYITSPAGAFVKTPTVTGRGYFAFAAAYVGNNAVTPTGLVDFQLKTKGLFYPSVLNFLSTQFDVLVVSGSQATLQGSGKVDGAGSYGFLLSIVDGQLFAGNKLRLKIWNKNSGNAVVYDNQMGAADNAAPTGAVTGLLSVSKSGGTSAAADISVQQLIDEDAANEMPTEYALMQNYPNPFNPSTTIRFDLPEAAKVRLVVYDMLGREVAVLADGERPAGQHALRFDASKLSSGMYIYRLQTGNFTQTRKLMLMK
ncbi:MAG: YDG domain-containing protein [Ignavibacteriales bacterium]|nr:YDG domain-containing protein [Ignavibacteriales bacterium]